MREEGILMAIWSCIAALARNGQIVVARLDEELTIKVFEQTPAASGCCRATPVLPDPGAGRCRIRARRLYGLIRPNRSVRR